MSKDVLLGLPDTQWLLLDIYLILIILSFCDTGAQTQGLHLELLHQPFL
jgi:hypothetical protein